jgi:type II secretory pathway component PulF
MTGTGSLGRPVSLDELIALNDEIAALARAGMPLERGLMNIGSDVPGRLGAITTRLGERMSAGMSLPDAIAASEGELPRVYRAVVQAGIQSGRLSVALEGLAMFARGFAESRRAISLALWYPMIVAIMAYSLFIFVILGVIPRFIDAFDKLRIPTHGAILALNRAGETVWIWGAIPPALVLVFLGAWLGSRRASSLGGGRSYWVLRGFPWMGSMLTWFEASSFAEILALLLEHRMPYPDALVLAGDASGDLALARASRELAESLRQGLSPSEAMRKAAALPPLLRWVIATGPRQGDLARQLKQMAARYRTQARLQADKIRLVLPTILFLAIGMSATLIYSLALFVPMSSLWQALAGPNS